MSSLKKNFVLNSFYQILSICIPLITTPYISRILGSEGVGRYSFSYTIANYFVLFAMLGINTHGSRVIASTKCDRNYLSRQFFSIYFVQFMLAAVSAIAYGMYVLLICSDKILACILTLNILAALVDINWLYVGLEKFSVTITRGVVIRLLTVLAIFLLVKSVDDVFIYAFIMSFGTLLSNIAIWPFALRDVHFCKVSAGEIKKHIKPILILFIPVIAVSLYRYMDKVMLGVMSSNVEVGYYESCEKITQVPVILVNSLGTVMLPRIASLVSEGDGIKSSNYMKKSIAFAMFISTSMSFGIMSVANEFVPWFYGDGYEPCVALFQFITPSCIFIAFANVIRTQYLIPYKMDNIYVMSTIFGAIINVILNLIFIPLWNSMGAAIATLAAEVSVCVVQIFSIRKDINIKKYILISTLFVISGLIMYIVLLNLKIVFESLLLNMLIRIVIGTGIYLCAIFAFILICLLITKHKIKVNGK